MQCNVALLISEGLSGGYKKGNFVLALDLCKQGDKLVKWNCIVKNNTLSWKSNSNPYTVQNIMQIVTKLSR